MKKFLTIIVATSLLFTLAQPAFASDEPPELKRLIDLYNKLPTWRDRARKNRKAFVRAHNAVFSAKPYQNISNTKKNAEVKCDICPPFITDEFKADFEQKINQQIEHFERTLKLEIPAAYKPFQVHLSDEDSACKKAPIGFAGAAMIRTQPGTICFSTFRFQKRDRKDQRDKKDESELTETIYHELLHFVLPIDEEFMHEIANFAPAILMLPKRDWKTVCALQLVTSKGQIMDRLCAIGFDPSTTPEFLAAYIKFVENIKRDEGRRAITAEDVKSFLDTWLGKNTNAVLHTYYMKIRNNPQSYNQSLLPPLYRND